MSEERRAAIAAAAMAFAVTSPLAYVVQRLYERAIGGSVNPLMILREAHTSFYWRCATAAWWGGVVAAVVYLVVQRGGRLPDPKRSSLFAFLLGALLLLLTWRYP